MVKPGVPVFAEEQVAQNISRACPSVDKGLSYRLSFRATNF